MYVMNYVQIPKIMMMITEELSLYVTLLPTLFHTVCFVIP